MHRYGGTAAGVHDGAAGRQLMTQVADVRPATAEPGLVCIVCAGWGNARLPVFGPRLEGSCGVTFEETRGGGVAGTSSWRWFPFYMKVNSWSGSNRETGVLYTFAGSG